MSRPQRFASLSSLPPTNAGGGCPGGACPAPASSSAYGSTYSSGVSRGTIRNSSDRGSSGGPTENQDGGVRSQISNCCRQTPIITLCLIIAMTTMWIYSTVKGGRWFVSDNYAVCGIFDLDDPETYRRLFAAPFFHLNALHIILNMLMLYFFGKEVHPIYVTYCVNVYATYYHVHFLFACLRIRSVPVYLPSYPLFLTHLTTVSKLHTSSLSPLSLKIERSMGSLSMIGQVFSTAFMTELIYILGMKLIHAITGSQSFLLTCAAGYSGILFYYFVVSIAIRNQPTVNICGASIPSCLYPWLLLIITSAISEGTFQHSLNLPLLIPFHFVFCFHFFLKNH